MKLREKLTYANVMATAAVFFALAGGAWAVSKAPKNSVVTKSIKNGAVKETKIADAAVTGAKVKGESLTGANVLNGTLSIADSAVLVTTVSQDFGVVAPNSCQTINKTVPATVQKDDWVVVLPDPTVGSGDNEWYGGALDANGGPTNVAPAASITLHVCNPTNAAGVDPPNTTFRVLVFR